MAKLPRIFQNIFGATAPSTDIGVFGSLAAGSPATGTNLTTLQSLSQFANGWKTAILGNNSPAIEDMNALFYLLTAQLAYGFQSGIAEWDTTTIYYTGSFVNVSGSIYKSLIDANSGNPPSSSPSQWQLYDTSPAGIIIPFAGINSPVGYGLCDGGADSRVGQIKLFSALSLAVTGQNGTGTQIISGLSSITGFIAGWPISGPNIPAGAVITSIDSASQIHISANTTGSNSAGTAFIVAPYGIGDGSTTFNRPDLRGRAMIGAGAGAGLTARILAAKLGEENHTLTLAELASHSHGGITGVDSPDHAHAPQQGDRFITESGTPGGVFTSSVPAGGAVDALTNNQITAGANTRHQHSVSADGGGGAHNNMQPSQVVTYIIKY